MKKAFTLIELLLVIAIIGIITGVILVNTSNSSAKAKDAKIMASALSIAKMAAVYGNSKGEVASTDGAQPRFFTNAAGLVSITDTASCATNITSTIFPATFATNTERTQILNACNDIVTANGSLPLTGSSNFHLWIGKSGGTTFGPLSVMAVLSNGRVYCAGTNGRSSQSSAVSGSGVYAQCTAGTNWTCPGCMNDPVL